MKRLKDSLLALLSGDRSYHPDCGPCGTVATAWARHFSDISARGPAVRMIALTRAGFPEASDFADRFDWHIEILSSQHQPEQRVHNDP